MDDPKEEGAESARSHARSFWNEFAERDHMTAIYDCAATRVQEGREQVFDEGGQADARSIAGFLHPRMTVLELGCGVGRIVRHVAPRCARVIGVDISSAMLAKAREHLAGVDNAELLATDGKSLEGVADGTIDFLYSFLCLIHVDKRSAFAYFREIARVLRPDALAQLQFHDILSAEGLDKFVANAESDYPLEFYSAEELEALLGRAGLHVIACERDEEYLFVTVSPAPRTAWRASLADLALDLGERAGLLLPATEPAGEGALSVRASWKGAGYFRSTAILSVAVPGSGDEASVLSVALPACLASGEEVSLRFELRAEAGGLSGAVTGADGATDAATVPLPPGAKRATVTIGLLPAGFTLGPAALTEFRELFVSFETTLAL